MINDDWTPDFVKVAPRSVEEDDPLKLEPNAMSLEGLQAIYRNPGLPLTTRMRAMMAAVPYESPKLIATAIVNEGSSAELLERRLKRIELIEAKQREQLRSSLRCLDCLIAGSAEYRGQFESPSFWC